MEASQTRRWPPPPDLESIRELVRAADPEGHLADGAHADEYELEEEAILKAIGDLDSAGLVATRTLPIIQAIWQKSFDLTDSAMTERITALRGLATEIERFFGPQATPQVRSQKPAR
jgi:hypothetical protein